MNFSVNPLRTPCKRPVKAVACYLGSDRATGSDTLFLEILFNHFIRDFLKNLRHLESLITFPQPLELFLQQSSHLPSQVSFGTLLPAASVLEGEMVGPFWKATPAGVKSPSW